MQRRGQLHPSSRALLTQIGGRRDQSNAEHRRIVAAIAEKATVAATEAMAAHLANIETTITRTPATSAGGEDAP